MEPVAWKELGLHDYPEVVREPMDLGSLEAAVVRGPCPSWAEFKRRVSLIWDNCHLYNKPGSDISRAATAMRRAATEAFRRIETSSRPAVRRVVHSGNAAGRPAAAFTAAAQPPPHSLQRPPPPPSRPDPRPQHAMQFAPVAAAAAAGGRGGGGGGVLPPRWGPSQQVPARIPLPWAFGGMMGHEAGMWAGAGYGHPPQYMSPSEAGRSGAHMGAGQAPPWAMWAPHWAPPGHAGQAGQAFIPRAYALPHSHGVPSSQPMAARGGAPSFLFPGGAPMPYHHVQGPYHGFYQ